jgi:hypothetical protein
MSFNSWEKENLMQLKIPVAFVSWWEKNPMIGSSLILCHNYYAVPHFWGSLEPWKNSACNYQFMLNKFLLRKKYLVLLQILIFFKQCKWFWNLFFCWGLNFISHFFHQDLKCEKFDLRSWHHVWSKTRGLGFNHLKVKQCIFQGGLINLWVFSNHHHLALPMDWLFFDWLEKKLSDLTNLEKQTIDFVTFRVGY